jgi:hypothetical protein
MTAPTSTVTTANLIIGAAISFKIDGQDIGGTDGDVTVEKQQKLQGITVDQIPGDVAEAITDESYTIKTNFAEATLENMQIAWGSSNAPTVVTGPPAGKSMNLGIERNVIEHTLEITGKAPNGNFRTFTFKRAINVTAGTQILSKTKQLTFPVSFQCLPDTSTPGAEYGTVSDAAAS